MGSRPATRLLSNYGNDSRGYKVAYQGTTFSRAARTSPLIGLLAPASGGSLIYATKH